MKPLPPPRLRQLLRAALHRPGRGGPLPPVTHRLAALDMGHVARYREALGLHRDGVPLSYAYLLAQRAHLDAMLAPGFGHRLVGLVHVGHALRQREPLQPGQALELVTEVEDEPERADGARYLRLQTRISQQGREVLSCASRYLARRRTHPGSGPARAEAEALGPAVASWSLAADAGRRYARLSGDWNPIHLWPWSARLLGMPAPLIHGAHSAARCQAEIEDLTGQAVAALDLEFLRPVPLGSTPVLHLDHARQALELRVDGRRALAGRWS